MLWWNGGFFQRKVFLLKWCSDDYLIFVSSLGGTEGKQRFYFFPLQLYYKKGQEGLFTVRRGVIVWNCYIRWQKRRAKRSVSCYYLVAVQQLNVQKCGCPGSAGCSVMKVRRCSKCACEEWSLKNPCPTNLSRFYLGEFHSVRRDFVQNNWLKRIPSHREYVLKNREFCDSQVAVAGCSGSSDADSVMPAGCSNIGRNSILCLLLLYVLLRLCVWK